MKPYQIKRIERAGLAVIMLAAVVLRFAGLRWGIPNEAHLFSYHPDEAPILGASWYMLITGDWDPHFYNYGTCYVYLIAAVAKGGAVMGFIPLPKGGWAELHLIARFLTALMGAATVYLVYSIGKSLGGVPVGFGAAALMAILPAHVVNSHYATVDVPATFFIALLFVILLRFFGRAELGWYLVAGLALGLAAATKYTVGLALITLIIAHFYASDEYGESPSILYLLAAVFVAVLAFFAVTPYLLVMTPEGFRLNPDLVRDVRFEMEHMRVGGTFAFANAGLGWIYHLLRSLPAAMGYVALAFGLVGAVLMIQRGGPVALVLFSFALPYFVLVGAGKEMFLRYMVPLLTVLAVSAAYALERLREASVPKLGKWGAVVAPALLGAACIFLTAWYAVQMVGIMMAPDVRTRAANWLRPQLTSTADVGLASTPWYFTPPITTFNGGLRSAADFRRWQEEDAPYRVTVIGWDAAALRQERPDYFIVSDAEYADLLRLQREDAVGLMDALPKTYRRIEVFEPPPPLPALRPDKLACPPDWLYTWPRIEVHY
ncbi:MAG: glycosyltransferase family 39 protein [Armatimonadota bacterium]|nr:MAG: glycosyltransferase family 39 protein [Armatimonadota bacterium]